jgi:hypothetical protein
MEPLGDPIGDFIRAVVNAPPILLAATAAAIVPLWLGHRFPPES